jgi:anti-sigma factor RsiW
VTGCDHVRIELGAYVLGALEYTEAETVRDHLTHCSECARDHASIAGLPELLALAEPIESAPPLAPAVEERVLDAVARERAKPEGGRTRRLRWRPRLMVPIAAVAAAALVALVLALSGDNGDGYQIALHPVAGSDAGGHARLRSTDGGTTVQLWVKNLPPDPNAVYEVRCEAPNWSASAGTFRTDANGRAYVILTTAARRGQYDSIDVVRRTRASSTDVLTASLN